MLQVLAIVCRARVNNGLRKLANDYYVIKSYSKL